METKTKQTFNVEVMRMSYAYNTVQVEANSLEEAEGKALDEAGDNNYSERDADYFITDSNEIPTLSPKDLEKIYHELDAECISETENVSMTTIRRIFEKYGAREKEMW